MTPKASSVSSPAASVGAGIALVGVVVVSYLSVAAVLGSAPNVFGDPASLADLKAQRTAGTVAIVLLIALVVVAAVSAAKGGTGARVAAGIAIVLGIGGVGIFGLLTWSAQDTIDERTPAPPAAAEPTCGPDYHPPFFGPDDTFRACDVDAEAALAAAQHVVAALADAPPTVDHLRQAMVEAGLERPSVYDDDGTRVRGIWTPAPMACAVVIGDSTGWHASATEVFMDGGCSDRPAGSE